MTIDNRAGDHHDRRYKGATCTMCASPPDHSVATRLWLMRPGSGGAMPPGYFGCDDRRGGVQASA